MTRPARDWLGEWQLWGVNKHFSGSALPSEGHRVVSKSEAETRLFRAKQALRDIQQERTHGVTANPEFIEQAIERGLRA